MRVGILGPIEIRDDDGTVMSPTRQSRRLVALMVSAGQASVTSDRLAEYLADGRVDGSAVRMAISRLRTVLGSRVETTALGYRLVFESDDELDANRFTALCEQALTASQPERQTLLREALGLWRGSALEELADEPWATPMATRLDELRAVAIEDLGEVLIETGRAADAVLLLETRIGDQPYRERPVALLMRALAASGRVTEALRWFQRFRTTLREDIGIEPTSELRRLEAELLDGFGETRDVALLTLRRLPTGTVTLMFTDIEGSTERWQHDEESMSEALASHDQTMRSVVDAHGGIVFKHTGAGVCAVFTSARAGVAAAIDAQQHLSLPVRIGVHTGEADLRDADYVGPTMNRAVRVTDAGHAGQILVSSITAALATDYDYVDLGEHYLKGLASPERIFQAGSATFPPLRAARQRVGNLPIELSTFIGRDDELARISSELADHRLVTLIGVGGTGKTRLAIEAAQVMAPTFPDGCWLVELAVVSVEEAVPFAFTTGLGIVAASDRDVVDDVVRALRQKRLLILVDNCEHLLGAAADVVERIVTSCPSVTVLATSREPLMVGGERLVPVPSLEASEAEQLFLQRARAEAPGLIIDAVQATAVSELCRRLDGLPLAIELAASRVRAFTPVELVAGLNERFRVLVGGRRARVERHQTMRGTLDWSYDLCTNVEQAVFDRLAVFPAGFDLLAARAVAADNDVSDVAVVDTVPRLVDRSLLQRSTASDGTTRYRMLETLRDYGRDHLNHAGIADATRERHARHTVATIRNIALNGLGPHERAAAERTVELLPDSIVALDWFIDRHDWEQGMHLLLPNVYADREGREMASRLHDAVRASGEFVDFIDELEMLDIHRQISGDDASTRAWRMIRSARPVPNGYHYYCPEVMLSYAGLSADDAAELIASLGRYVNAPPPVRFQASWGTAQALALNGHLELAQGLLTRVQVEVDGLQSPRCGCFLAELRGQIAASSLDWAAAARWYSAAARPIDETRPPSHFDLTVEWDGLAARVLAGHEIDGADLRRPWTWLRDQGITLQTWRGAVSSAIAVDRLGHHDLAERLINWVQQSNPNVAVRFTRVIAAAGLDNVPSRQIDDLDTLIDEIIAVADQTDLQRSENHTGSGESFLLPPIRQQPESPPPSSAQPAR